MRALNIMILLLPVKKIEIEDVGDAAADDDDADDDDFNIYCCYYFNYVNMLVVITFSLSFLFVCPSVRQSLHPFVGYSFPLCINNFVPMSMKMVIAFTLFSFD